MASLRDWTGRSVRSFHSIFFLFFGVFCSWAWMTVKVRAWVSLLLANGREGSDPAISDFENGLFQITFNVVSHLDAMQPLY